MRSVKDTKTQSVSPRINVIHIYTEMNVKLDAYTECILIVGPWECGSTKIKLGSGSVSACCGFCGGPHWLPHTHTQSPNQIQSTATQSQVTYSTAAAYDCVYTHVAVTLPRRMTPDYETDNNATASVDSSSTIYPGSGSHDITQK